ncbi:hypothetical protein HON22_01995 [Candidatus Peregrinibacteria bacterium]|jgi:hypothetical protein|nr:hypothetical protein [Candidatus Peregrinibacteria bacterium]
MSGSNTKGKGGEVIYIHTDKKDGREIASRFPLPENIEPTEQELRMMALMSIVVRETIDERVPQIIDERVPQIIDERVPKIIDERVPKIIESQVPAIVKKETDALGEKMDAGFAFLGRAMIEEHGISDKKATLLHNKTFLNLASSKQRKKPVSDEDLRAAQEKVDDINLEEVEKDEQKWKESIMSFVSQAEGEGEND